jgi:16S rRNA (guanine527-N7)-methyltransferase
MFHVKLGIRPSVSVMESATAATVAEWAGHRLGTASSALLESYAEWLVEEAIPAGGLGPREGDRIWDRHIADSLSFAVAWDRAPDELLDVGSGVGLPGIPLAILWPDTEVTLLDRGGRRIRLLQRVVRLLGLDNAIVAKGDAFDVADTWEAMAFRGSVPAPEAVGLVARMLASGGTAAFGLSRRTAPPDRTSDLVALGEGLGLAMEVGEVPAAILETPGWLLIMRDRGG